VPLKKRTGLQLESLRKAEDDQATARIEKKAIPGGDGRNKAQEDELREPLRQTNANG